MGLISIEKATNLIKSGEPVAFPTETVYGLGADAWNPSAVRKVFSLKGRPADNPLIVHIASREMMQEFVEEIPPEAELLMEAFWPGPLTLVFKKKPAVLDLITGGLPTVALRWPDHPGARNLISVSGPLVAPSANTSGKPSPTKPDHVFEDFGTGFPVLDGGNTAIGLESTVLDVTRKPFRIYRPGKIGKTELEEVLHTRIAVEKTESENAEIRSPGTKYSHYSPQADVRWLKRNEQPESANRSLYLLHSRDSDNGHDSENIVKYNRDYQRMARELYDRFRQADHSGFSEVVIEPLPVQPATPYAAVTEALKNRIEKALK